MKLSAGLIFYKYLSDKLLKKVVELRYEDENTYNTKEKQTELYESLISDKNTAEDLKATLIDTLGYEIEPEYLFNTLIKKTKLNTFQLDDMKKAFAQLSANYEQFIGLFDDIDLNSNKLWTSPQQGNAWKLSVR